MNLRITPNRAATVAESSNPTAADLGGRMVRYLESLVADSPQPFTALATVSVTLEGPDAETAAGALMGTDLLTEAERDAYMASAFE